MMTRPRFLALPFLLSLAGMLFCCWNLWGAPEALCVTEGCRLFQNVAVAGVSLWAVGAGAFAGLLLAALLGLAPLGRCASAFGLALDCALLCVMIAAAPCFNCLIIGLLLALTFLAFHSACGGRSGGRRIGERPRAGHSVSLLFAVWGVLFLLDAGVVAHGLMKTWPLPAGNAAAATRIYFSPSCGACRDLVAASAGAAPDIAWYPVAEREEDLAAIAALLLRTEAGESLPAALESVRAGGDSAGESAVRALSPAQRAALQLRLWRNRAHVLEAGSDRLPFVEFAGAPAMLLRGESSAGDFPGAAEGAGRTVDESLFGVSGFCAGEEPCEKPEHPASGSLHALMNGI